MIGAYDAASAELIAGTVAGMAIRRVWVIHGAGGWDEATPIGPFLAFDVKPGAIVKQYIDPREFGLAPCSADELAGGDATANLKALLDVFEGRDRGAHRAALVLQCGLALYVAGRTASIAGGIAKAGAVIDSGRASLWTDTLRAFAARQAAAVRVRA